MATFLLVDDGEAVKISEITGFAVDSGEYSGDTKTLIEFFTEKRVYSIRLKKGFSRDRVAKVIAVAGAVCGSSVDWTEAEEVLDKADQAEEEFHQSVADFKNEAKTVIGFIENFFSGK